MSPDRSVTLTGVRVEADGPEGVVVLLDGVDLTLTAPRVAVIGENGSGKSTLARAIAAHSSSTAPSPCARRPRGAGCF